MVAKEAAPARTTLNWARTVHKALRLQRPGLSMVAMDLPVNLVLQQRSHSEHFPPVVTRRAIRARSVPTAIWVNPGPAAMAVECLLFLVLVPVISRTTFMLLEQAG